MIIQPCLFLPYIFRAIKLISIFNKQRHYVIEKITTGKYNMQIKKTSKCIEPRSVVLWFSCIMFCFLIIFIAMAVSDFEYAMYLPIMMIQECIPIDEKPIDDSKYHLFVEKIVKEQSIFLLIYDAGICCILAYLSYEMSDIQK